MGLDLRISFPRWLSMRRRLALAGALYFACLSYWAVDALRYPLANWDIVPYTAAAMAPMVPPDELRTRTYADIRLFVGAEHYAQVLSGSYAGSVATDDKVLQAQLPFYTVKPLYVLMVRWLGSAIENYAAATVWIAVLGWALLGTAMACLRPRECEPFVWYAAAMALLSIGQPMFRLMAAASTPDSLAAGLFLAGVLIRLRGVHVAGMLILWSLAILVRPDYVVTCCIVAAPMALASGFPKSARAVWLACVAGASLVYFISTKVWPGYPWSVLLAHSLAGPYVDPVGMAPGAWSGIYWHGLAADVRWLLQQPRPLLFFAVALWAVWRKEKPASFLAVSAVLHIVAKVVLFPNIDAGHQERYFFVSYVLILIAATMPNRKPGTAAVFKP